VIRCEALPIALVNRQRAHHRHQDRDHATCNDTVNSAS
jgi:hypothetical protein